MIKRILTCILLLASIVYSFSQDVNRKSFRGNIHGCVVKSNGEWYVINSNIVSFNKYPNLQKYITYVLFNEENTSVKDGYYRFINSFDGIEPLNNYKKAKGKEINIKLIISQEEKGQYMSLVAEYITKNIDNQENKFLHIIFNEQTESILSASDILKEPCLTQYRRTAQGASLQFHTNKNGLYYGYEEDNQYHSQLVPYQKGDSVFTDSFKKLINWKLFKEIADYNDSLQAAKQKRIREQVYVENKIYDEVDYMPMYPGGKEAMGKFISSIMPRYPYKEYGNFVLKRIIVDFVVEKDGSTSNHMVKQSISTDLDNAAISLIKRMPKWKPGKLNDQTVRVRNTLTIEIFLKENKDGSIDLNYPLTNAN